MPRMAVAFAPVPLVTNPAINVLLPSPTKERTERLVSRLAVAVGLTDRIVPTLSTEPLGLVTVQK